MNAKRKGSSKKPAPLPFSRQLLLNQWLFSLIGLDSVNGRIPIDGREVPLIEALRDRHQMQGETAGRDADGVHQVVLALRRNVDGLPGIDDDALGEYDRNIQRITELLNSGRAKRQLPPIEWKYFQYLMLLFTEIYLDWLFRAPGELRAVLNAQAERWNAAHPEQPPFAPLDDSEEAWRQLNKVAFWSATGSGKTLLMHANILQYRHYLAKHGRRRELNKVILLTPNEGLTRQHLEELHATGIHASEFSKDLRSDSLVESVIVIDINKFRDAAGVKTIATASLQNNNLVLVDEGHRGASGGGGEWLRHRNALCEAGFSFEYSATFAQAASAHDDLRQQYARAILFDYSYRFFYADGYGKQSQILNLEKNLTEEDHYAYLVAGLLSFYQQRRLYDEQRAAFKPFNLEAPLWIFVSSKVTASLTTGEASDTVQVLQFLDRVLSERTATVAAIRRLLSEGLVAHGGHDLLAGRLDWLKGLAVSPEVHYDDLLERLFHCRGGRLHIENISGAKGELALHGGSATTPFGVINVGDEAKLFKLCEESGLLTQEGRFAESLFHTINRADSSINLLIGSKKFTEGWSSWRVSNMTLMNVGKGEGAQIIQLFGRGVRLKGWGETLKRSAELVPLLPDGVDRPKPIGILETLNIFGVKADYIAQFRKELEDEEIPLNEALEEYRLPLKPMPGVPSETLKVIRLKASVAGCALKGEGSAFSQLAEQVLLLPLSRLAPEERRYFVDSPRVTLDWYPRMRGFATEQAKSGEVVLHKGELGELHLALLDYDRLYYDLLDFKRAKRWSNLTLDRALIAEILRSPAWYRLYVPKAILRPAALDGVNNWQAIAAALLRKYCEAFYQWRQRRWEGDKLEYIPVSRHDYLPGVGEETPEGSYLITLDQVRDKSLVSQLDTLRTAILAGRVDEWRESLPVGGLSLLFCERHLYQPLLAQHGSSVELAVSPVPLNGGEQRFVTDLQQALENGLFSDCEVYLLRNESRGKGVGFFAEGGFYPDFILWLLQGEEQRIVFIDPKGLRNLTPGHPKVRFHQSIKQIEAELHAGGASHRRIGLHAFLLSNTHADTLLTQWGGYDQTLTRETLDGWNILFQEEGGEAYLGRLRERVLG